MKKILIAATIVGAAVASIVLYLQNQNSTENKIEDAAEDANQVMNKHLRRVENATDEILK